MIDWLAWATFGFGATVALTSTMVFAQLAGWSRMDLPMILGTMFTPDPDRARVVGFFMHLFNGQVFALAYAAAFAVLGQATWWLGALFGAAHGLAALVVVMPLLTGIHPRMASERTGPSLDAVLEPPGLFGLNFGPRTPLITMVSHVIYGALLGIFLEPR